MININLCTRVPVGCVRDAEVCCRHNRHRKHPGQPDRQGERAPRGVSGNLPGVAARNAQALGSHTSLDLLR